MTFLLDVNVLIALIDDEHVAHESAHAWFGQEGSADWATCPITVNGAIRILGNARYPGGPGSCSVVAAVMSELTSVEAHRFWPDDLDLLRSDILDLLKLPASQHLTDSYLLALAVKNQGRLATLDRRLSPTAVRGGREALRILD